YRRKNMELEVSQEKLAKALNLVSRVAVGAKSTLPILTNVLIKANKGKVSLTTTNLDMAIIDYIPVISAEDGAITVPARLLAEFAQNLPHKEKIKIKSDNNKVKITAGKYSSVINGIAPDDFPELPEIDEEKSVTYKMPVDEFKAGLEQIVIAASGDTTRPALTGVYFNTDDGNLYIAATDGYRLAEKLFIKGVESEVKAIVPKATLQEVLRSISDDVEEVECIFDDSQVRFRMGEVEIISKLIDGTFPDYRRLIPDDNNVKLVLDREELIRIVKMAGLFARESNRVIVCESSKDNGVLYVYSISNEVGENKSEINTEVKLDGKVKVDSRYLLEALSVCDEDKVKFEFGDNGVPPILIMNAKNKDYRHIVMPLNI
ncbi:DNA polymerase III subunit beta, partial [Candidatus Saccharibacteria bacterium]|nr:DNA polymerase III subunit beta [Candidatus Saccharibacteria bacterium]